MMKKTAGLVLILLCAGSYTWAVYAEGIIPMRDGRALAADFYYVQPITRKPTILIQTPYNKALLRSVTLPFDLNKYHVIIVDWRGFYASAGAAVPGYDFGLDGYDCVEWIAGQLWSDGKVGTYGGSALGAIQFMTARHRPPHLICAMPTITDFKKGYSNFYSGGDYRKENTEAHSQFFDIPTILSHPSLDDYWTDYEAANDYADRIAVPVLMASGWFDHYPPQIMRDFRDLQLNSEPQVRNKHKIVFGPWSHTTMNQSRQGQLDFPEAVGLLETMTSDFFEYYLRGVATGYESQPAVQFFQMGENRWMTASEWPGYSTRQGTLYLQPGGQLGRLIWPMAQAVDSFQYNPADTALYLSDTPIDLSNSIEKRGDVLVYSSAVLTKPVTIQGGVWAELYVSSDRVDTDFSVWLCDVDANGRSMQMAVGIRRMRYRDSLSEPQLMTPGQIYKITVDLGELGLTFPAGHRVRLSISSSCYPRYEKNLNNGDEMYPPAGTPSTARNSVYHSILYRSRLVWEYR
jgi:predicted acyl esterase